jgi:hypothetical protein
VPTLLLLLLLLKSVFRTSKTKKQWIWVVNYAWPFSIWWQNHLIIVWIVVMYARFMVAHRHQMEDGSSILVCETLRLPKHKLTSKSYRNAFSSLPATFSKCLIYLTDNPMLEQTQYESSIIARGIFFLPYTSQHEPNNSIQKQLLNIFFCSSIYPYSTFIIRPRNMTFGYIWELERADIEHYENLGN